MKKKSFLALLLIGLFMFTGCFNSASRPSSQFANIREYMAYYTDAEFTTSIEFGSGFVRNLAGLVMKKDDVNEFSDWTVSSQTEEGVIVYSKEVTLFGCEATLTVGFEKKQTKIGAVSLVIKPSDTATGYKFFSWFYKGLLDSTAKPNSVYIDAEEKSSTDVEKLISAYDNTHSVIATWPKSSVKWSCIIQYQLAEDGTCFVGVYAK